MSDQYLPRIREVIQSHLDTIATDIGARPVGSSANLATYDYLNEVITGAGVDASTFESTIDYPMATEWSCIDSMGPVAILPGASSLALDVVDAPVMPYVYATPDDFVSRPPERGSIAVVSLGVAHESQLCALAEPAAAVAWFRQGHPGLYSGNCKRPDTEPLVAGFAIDEPTAMRWISEPTRVAVQIAVEGRVVTLRSIICDFAKKQGPVPCFIAHYDSKPMAPGGNDNASGVAVLLAMLEMWPQDRPARFIFFDGEEIGVQGSTAYVEDLERTHGLGDIECVICPDSVGLGQLHLYTADKYGSFPEPLLRRARAVFRDHNWLIPERAARSGGSDYQPFHIRGIPSVFLSDFPNHVRHTTVDNASNVDVDVLARLAVVLTNAQWSL